MKGVDIWNNLAEIPMDETGEFIDIDFMHFEKGTEKYEIWQYIEEIDANFSVYDALYNEEQEFINQ